MKMAMSPSLSYTRQFISTLSWTVATEFLNVHVATLQCHTSAVQFCLLSRSGYLTSSTWAQICNMQLLDSVTETTHKSMYIDMLYKNTLGVKKVSPSWKHHLMFNV